MSSQSNKRAPFSPTRKNPLSLEEAISLLGIPDMRFEPLIAHDDLDGLEDLAFLPELPQQQVEAPSQSRLEQASFVEPVSFAEATSSQEANPSHNVHSNVDHRSRLTLPMEVIVNPESPPQVDVSPQSDEPLSPTFLLDHSALATVYGADLAQVESEVKSDAIVEGMVGVTGTESIKEVQGDQFAAHEALPQEQFQNTDSADVSEERSDQNGALVPEPNTVQLSESDYRKALHDLLPHIKSLVDTNRTVLDYLAPNPFDPYQRPTSADLEVFRKPCDTLLVQLLKMFESIGDGVEERKIDPEAWKELTGFADELRRTELSRTPTFAERLGRRASLIPKLLEGMKLQKELKKNVNEAAKEISRLTCLYLMTNAINDVNRFKSQLVTMIQSPLQRRPKTVHLRDIVTPTVDELQARANRLGIKFKYFPEKNPPGTVFVDPVGLRHAINHILDNAIKYTGKLSAGSKYEYTWIEVWMTESETESTLSVQSWGVPFTDVELKERRYASSSGRGFFATIKDVAGSGRGLYEVDQLATRFHGRLEIESEAVPRPSGRCDPNKIPIKQTTVSLTFPNSLR